jgi:hypothetical protein
VISRRNFLKSLAVAPIAARLVSLGVDLDPGYRFVIPEGAAVISSYADYASFSDTVIASAFDDLIQNAAVELGAAAGKEISEYAYFAYS